jgi:hypothetical protein
MIELGGATLLMNQQTAATFEQMKQERDGKMKELYNLMKINGDI